MKRALFLLVFLFMVGITTSYCQTKSELRTLARNSIKVTNTAGANATYDSAAGVINIPIATGGGGSTPQTLQQTTATGNTTNNDIEITDFTKGVIIRSPNGTRWRFTVSNTGALITTQVL